METTPSTDKIILSYQGATFQRTLTLLAIGATIILIVVFVKFPRQTPPPGAVAGPSIISLFLGFAGVVCLISAIMDALFVAGVHYAGEKSCDKENLYLRHWGKDLVIPLEAITSIKLSPIGGSNGTRGRASGYDINYDADGIHRSVQLTVYYRTRDSFNLFKERVQRKNPSIEVKNWVIY